MSYYHVRIAKKSGRKRWVFGFDYSRKRIEEEVVFPFTKQQPFMVENSPIEPLDVEQIEISETEETSSQILARTKARRVAEIILSTTEEEKIYVNENRIIKSGKNVTKEFIKGFIASPKQEVTVSKFPFLKKEKKGEEGIIVKPIFKGRFPTESNLCFVLIPLRENFVRLYDNQIKPTLEGKGFNVVKADDIYSLSTIVEDIWEYINKARFIIADVTTRNPNVFYELGIAHTLGKDTVVLTQDENDVPFDLKHIRHFIYTDNEEGWKSLKHDLEEIAKLINSGSKF
jgi:hypothetical protein